MIITRFNRRYRLHKKAASAKLAQKNILALIPGLLLVLLPACQQPIKQSEIQTTPDKASSIPGSKPSDTTKAAETLTASQTSEKNITQDVNAAQTGAPAPNSEIKHNLKVKNELKQVASPKPESKPTPVIIQPEPVTPRSRKTLRGQNKFYDRNNPDYKTLQKANHALAGFPADYEGQINWVLALERGLIKPRTTVRSRKPMEILDTDIIMKNTREMAYVRFPHEAHTEWLACKNCHEKIFIEKKGANDINMTKIFQGEYCGVCHDKVAFSSFVCERCHSIPNTEVQ